MKITTKYDSYGFARESIPAFALLQTDHNPIRNALKQIKLMHTVMSLNDRTNVLGSTDERKTQESRAGGDVDAQDTQRVIYGASCF